MKKTILNIRDRIVEEYLYLFKGIELGPHIERRMLKFQTKVQRMMKRRGIALVAYNLKEGGVSLSYVPEKQWNEQKDIIEQIKLNETGDKINEPENKDNTPPEATVPNRG